MKKKVFLFVRSGQNRCYLGAEVAAAAEKTATFSAIIAAFSAITSGFVLSPLRTALPDLLRAAEEDEADARAEEAKEEAAELASPAATEATRYRARSTTCTSRGREADGGRRGIDHRVTCGYTSNIKCYL